MASAKFGQIRPKIWPKPNLAEFGKNGRISAWPKPKFGATLINCCSCYYHDHHHPLDCFTLLSLPSSLTPCLLPLFSFSRIPSLISLLPYPFLSSCPTSPRLHFRPLLPISFSSFLLSLPTPFLPTPCSLSLILPSSLPPFGGMHPVVLLGGLGLFM